MPMPADAGSPTKSVSAELTASHLVTVASAVGSSIEPDTSSITYMSSGMRSASIRLPAHSSPTAELLPPFVALSPASPPSTGPVPVLPATPVPFAPVPFAAVPSPPLTLELELEPHADATPNSKPAAAKTGQAARENLMRGSQHALTDSKSGPDY